MTQLPYTGKRIDELLQSVADLLTQSGTIAVIRDGKITGATVQELEAQNGENLP